MALTTSQIEILRQLFDNLSTEQRADFVAWMNAAPEAAVPAAVASIEAFLAQKNPVSVCPHCGSAHILKNGVRNGRQRFVCKDCRKSFVRASQSILYRTQKGRMASRAAYEHLGLTGLYKEPETEQLRMELE